METLLLLLLLFSDRNRDPKAALSSLLSFYRENRELLASIAAARTENASPAPASEPPAREQTKSRPREDAVGEKDILQQFLSGKRY